MTFRSARSTRRAATLAALVGAMIVASIAWAAIDPELLEDEQRTAPEQLLVDVIEVKTTTKGNTTTVRAKAKVVEVRRSNSKLAVGATITISYSSRRPSKEDVDEGWTGPAPTPILKKELTGAYLGYANKTGVYRPTAGHLSFVSPAEFHRAPDSRWDDDGEDDDVIPPKPPSKEK